MEGTVGWFMVKGQCSYRCSLDILGIIQPLPELYRIEFIPHLYTCISMCVCIYLEIHIHVCLCGVVNDISMDIGDRCSEIGVKDLYCRW